MSEIKSALELALERTKDIEADKESIRAGELNKQGRRIASRFFDPVEEKVDLKKELKAFNAKDAAVVRQGIFEIFMTRLKLPKEDGYQEEFASLTKGMAVLAKNSRNAEHILAQVGQFFEQYLQNREMLKGNLEQQYAPQLRQKEAEMAKMMGGQEVHLQAEQDPDFQRLLAQNLGQLEAQYTEAIAEVKEQLKQTL